MARSHRSRSRSRSRPAPSRSTRRAPPSSSSSASASAGAPLPALGLPPLPVTLRRHQHRLVAKVVLDARNLLFVAGTGSGKTIAAIVAGVGLLARGVVNGVHVVTPKSVCGQFQAVVNHVAPPEMRDAFLVTTHHQYFKAERVPATNKFLVVDEAHTAMSTSIETDARGDVKSGKLPFYAIAAACQATRVLLLTATPLKNTPTELFNLLAAVRQVPYAEFYAWVKPWRKMMVQQQKAFVRTGSRQVLARTNANLSFYAQQVAPLLQFARASTEGFPTRIDQPAHLTMDKAYLALYNAVEAAETEAFVRKLHERAAKHAGTKHAVTKHAGTKHAGTKHVGEATNRGDQGAPLQYLFDPHSVDYFYTKLRQTVNGCTKDLVSTKIDFTVQVLVRAHRRGHRAIAYSHFLNGGLHLVGRELRDAGVPYVEVIGATSAKDRQAHVEALNTGEVNVLLLSQAGSEGLDLQAVRDVVLLEPHFHDVVSQQVIGRAIRYRSHDALPPSQRTVTVHRVLLSKPSASGERWEAVEARNEAKLRALVERYGKATTGPAHTTVELTLNPTTRDAVVAALELANLPPTTFVFHPRLQMSDARVLVTVRGGLFLYRADDDYDETVVLEPPPTDLSVDDILDRMASRKQHLVDEHLRMLRRRAR